MATDRFDRLVEMHQAKLVGYVKRISRDLSIEDAREIANEAFLEIWKRLTRIGPGAEAKYLYMTAHSRALNRVLRRPPQNEVGLEHAPPLYDEALPADEELVHREQQSEIEVRIGNALAALPEKTRLCVIGRIKGLSCEAIAAMLQEKTSVNVRSRLSRAKKQLHEAVGTIPDWFEWPETAGEDGHGDEK
ncbi:MAG TPA: sigma-70 family RNA polymerase sigma factor [Thermoanaerobaculia bacterium]|nr:sigma-70 family RNA polymerase sigma factor [Thermoanaerobaculia bacterium]